MLNPELWAVGLTTMIVGMGIVFSFLIILVFAIFIMTKVVAWLNVVCPLPVVEAKTAKKSVSSDDEQVAVAIAVAMAQR